jgi:hypothetical protein
MMKMCSALVLVSVLVSDASADLPLVGVPSEPISIGETVTITVVPEPTTIALPSLGSLLLRRRK